jgi:hypothetical protein
MHQMCEKCLVFGFPEGIVNMTGATTLPWKPAEGIKSVPLPYTCMGNSWCNDSLKTSLDVFTYSRTNFVAISPNTGALLDCSAPIPTDSTSNASTDALSETESAPIGGKKLHLPPNSYIDSISWPITSFADCKCNWGYNRNNDTETCTKPT